MGKQVIFALDNIILVKIVLDKFQENCEKLFDTKEFVESGEENLESGLSFVFIEIFLSDPGIPGVRSMGLISLSTTPLWNLGKPVRTKMDEISENFRTAFDPPPLFGKNVVIFSEIHDD